MFYFSGHFYDEVDIVEYKNQQKKKKIKSDNILNKKKNNNEIFFEMENVLNIGTNLELISYNGIKLNVIQNQKNNKINNDKKMNNLGIEDYNDSINIKESSSDIIYVNKIKNKKDIYYLSNEEKKSSKILLN